MNSLTIGILIGIGVVLLYLILAYNRLITLKNRIDNSWAQIDVQLKRRFDLIPNLIETVKGYAKHEKKVFTEVTAARTAMMGAHTLPEKAKANNMLSSTLKSLFAVAEDYPKLQKFGAVRMLSQRIGLKKHTMEERMVIIIQWHGTKITMADGLSILNWATPKNLIQIHCTRSIF